MWSRPKTPSRRASDAAGCRSRVGEDVGPCVAVVLSLAVAVAVLVVASAATVAYQRLLVSDWISENSTLIQQAAPPGTSMVSGGVVSPQGGHFAFIAREQQTGRTSLWIRAVNALEPQRVPGADGASQPFFSPDGKTIAFFAKGRLLATDVNRHAPAHDRVGARGRSPEEAGAPMMSSCLPSG